MANKPNDAHHVSPVKLELLVTIVDKKKANFYIDLIHSFDVNLSVKFLAEGTAKQEVLRNLGLTSTDKIVIFSVVRADRLDALLELLEQKFHTIKNGNGVAAAIPLTSMIGTLLFGFLSNDERMVKEVSQ